MPGLDRTGPQGQGQMTGRGLGPCGGGIGRGFGCRGGRFAGRTYLTKTEEAEDLENEAKILGEDLKAVNERLSEIKG